ASGASGETLGILRVIQGQVFLFRNEVRLAAGVAGEALDLVPAGAMPWFAAATITVVASFQLADFVALAPLLGRLTSLREVPPPDGPVASALSPLIFTLFAAEQVDQALALAGLLERSAEQRSEHDPTFAGFLLAVRSAVAQFVDLDLGAMVRN